MSSHSTSFTGYSERYEVIFFFCVVLLFVPLCSPTSCLFLCVVLLFVPLCGPTLCSSVWSYCLFLCVFLLFVPLCGPTLCSSVCSCSLFLCVFLQSVPLCVRADCRVPSCRKRCSARSPSNLRWGITMRSSMARVLSTSRTFPSRPARPTNSWTRSLNSTSSTSRLPSSSSFLVKEFRDRV